MSKLVPGWCTRLNYMSNRCNMLNSNHNSSSLEFSGCSGGGLVSEYARILDEIIGLLNIEMYSSVGVGSGDKLVLMGLKEGAVNSYSFDGSELVKLNKEPISGIARVPYGADKIVFIRDVSHGKEQHLIYTVDLDEPGNEKPLEGMEPMRVLGVVYDDHRIVYSASTVAENAIFMAENDVKMISTLPGFAMVSDIHDKYAVGVGLLEPATGRFQAFVANLDTGGIDVYKNMDGNALTARFSPEGWVLIAIEGSTKAKLLRLNRRTMEAEPLELPGKDLDQFEPRSYNYIGFLPDGELVVVGRKNGRTKVFVDGYAINVPEGTHGGVYRWKNRLVLTHTSLRNPARIIDVDGEVVLSGKVPDYIQEALGSSGFHLVESFDGSKVPTYTVESKRAGKPGPTILLVHGGPFSEDADVWDFFTASLALAGYNVVKPNYRGSTGYGDQWRMKIIGDPCGGELEDIISVAKWSLLQGIANTLYVMGYSYGGYMTMCALTKYPGMFKAGVAGASVVDWRQMYELSDAAFKSFIQMLFGGKMNLLEERSPITYIDNLSDLLMIVHPQNDSRTPLKPVLHFMEQAVDKGKTFEAYIAPDMGHAIMKVDDILKILYPGILFLLQNK